MGTGPFVLNSYNGIGGGGYTLTPNPKYWAAAAATAEPWNVNLAGGQHDGRGRLPGRDRHHDERPHERGRPGGVVRLRRPVDDPAVGRALQRRRPAAPDDLRRDERLVVDLPEPVACSRSTTSRSGRRSRTRSTTSRSSNRRSGATPANGSGPVPPSYPYNNNVTANAAVLTQYDLKLAYQEMADSPCAPRRLRRNVHQLHVPQHGDRLGGDGPVPRSRPEGDQHHDRPPGRR